MAASKIPLYAAVADLSPAFVLDWEALITKGDESATDFSFDEGVTYSITGTLILDGTTTFSENSTLKFADWLTPNAIQIYGPVRFQGSQYRPVILTGKDDDRYGVVLPGSTGAPWNNRYGAPMIYLGSGTPAVDLAHFRLFFANMGLWFDNGSQENLIRHAQIDRTWTPTYGGLLRVRNVLAHDVDQVFYGATVHAEHLTTHTAFWVADSTTLYLTNSLVVDTYDSPEWYVTDHSEWRTEQDGVFQIVGAGSHYLADSSLRDAGTTAIDPTLAAELRRTTTYPPTLLTNAVAEDTTLGPTPIDDADQPDLGYHYPVVHYAANCLRMQNSTLMLTEGTVIATFGPAGIWLDGGHLISRGSWEEPNYILPYTVVQEQPIDWGSPANPYVIVLNTYTYGPIPPSIRLTCTRLERPRADANHLYCVSEWRASRIELRDCEVRGGKIYSYAFDPEIADWAITNSLLHGVSCQFTWGPGLFAFNNTFKACAISLEKWGTAPWELRDNLFDSCALSHYDDGDPVAHSHNGYVNMTGRLQPAPGTGDQVLAELPYVSGPLGHYYLPQMINGVTNPLINGGSRSASAAGLYHYTTTGLAKEAESQVDIAGHYVMTLAGVPTDFDGDGLADAIEDTDGNGDFDQPPDLSDWRDFGPLSRDAATGPTGLSVFTPLK